MSPAATSHAVEEQTIGDLDAAESGAQSKPGAAPDPKRKAKPASVRRLSFHFEIGFKKVVRAAPQHDVEARGNGAERNANPLPQVRRISGGNAAPNAALAAAQFQALDGAGAVPAGAEGGGSSGSSTSTWSVYAGGDTTYTVSPPNTVTDPYGGGVGQRV